MITPIKLCKDVTVNSIQGGIVGAGAVATVGVLSGLAVPYAMSTFGTVVSGVGTIHSAGGVAANLQILNYMLLSTNSIAVAGGISAGWNAIKPIKRVRDIKNYIIPNKNK